MNSHVTLKSKLSDLKDNCVSALESIFLNNQKHTKKYIKEEFGKKQEIDVLIFDEFLYEINFGIAIVEGSVGLVSGDLLAGEEQQAYFKHEKFCSAEEMIRIIEKLEKKYN